MTSAFSWYYTDLDEALKAIDIAVQETIADNPEMERQEDTIYWEICQAIQYDCEPTMRKELARVTGVAYVER